jgi:hypothetical protein
VRTIELLVLLLAGATVIAGCGRSEPTGYASPEEAYAAMHDAVEAKDWETFAGCLTPECRATQAGAMVMMARLMAMDAEMRSEVEEILKEHGLDEAEDPKAKGPLKTEVELTYEEPWGVSAEEEPRLSATLKLSGKPVAEATAYGFVQLNSARDDKGKTLKEIKDDTGFMGPTDETERFQSRAPDSTEDITLTLERPSPDATSLAVLEGSLKLMTGGRGEKIYIGGITAKKPGDVLQHPTLKAAGATVRLDEPSGDPEEGAVTVNVSVSGPVGEIDLVDSDGSPVAAATGFGGGMRGGAQYVSRQFTSSRALPSDTRLELEVFLDQKPLLVPFRFENVPLPSEQQEDERQPAGGWPFEENPKEMAAPIKDKIAFIAQMMALLDRVSEGQARFPGKGKLAELKIDGDTATAVVVTNEDGAEQKESIEFRRIDDGWFIRFSEGYFSM